MRKLIVTIAATLALGGVGLATHTATSEAPADESVAGGYILLPYVEQDNLYKQVSVSV